MKIKIKNNNNLNESSLFELDNPIKQTEENQTNNNAYNAYVKSAEHMYIQEKRKDSLPIDLVIPQSLRENIDIPKAPTDISNIMSSFQTNKAKKTENIGGVMIDPIETYNQAEDKCKTVFTKFFNDGVNITTNKQEIKNNKSTIGESVLFNTINEDAFTTGKAVGDVAFSIGAGISKFMIGAATPTATAIAPVLAAISLGSTGIGYVGQLVAGDAAGKGSENDSVVKQLNDIRKNQIQVSDKMPMENGNIVEALDKYILDVTDALENIVTALSPQAATKLGELNDFISNILTTETKEINDYLKANSKLLQKQQEDIKRQQEAENAKDLNNANKVIEFSSQLAASVAKSGKNPALMSDIISFYKDHVDDKSGIKMREVLKAQGYDAVSQLFIGSKKENSSYEYKGNNFLNEGEVQMQQDSNKPSFNLDKIYKRILVEIKTRINEAINNIDAKNLNGLEDAKQQMTDMVNAADNEIKHKIELITKSPQGENFGKETGLGAAARRFLMGHPIEAETLNGIWSRHLADLNNRKSRRIQQMSDLNEPSRTLGWTKELCKSVMPELLARLLTYRYGYAILSNEGIYNYDTPQMEKDKQAFTEIKDVYTDAVRSKLFWLLNTYSGDYTNDGKSIVSENNDGGFIMNDNYLAYASFFITRIGGLKNNVQLQQNITSIGDALANIKEAYPDPSERFEKFMDLVYGNLGKQYQNLITGIDADGNSKDAKQKEEEFNKLANRFKLPDEFKEVKPLIQDTYTKISQEYKGRVDEILGEDSDKIAQKMGASFNLIWSNPNTIYINYLKNKQTVDNLIEEYKDYFYSINDNVTADDIENDDTKSLISEDKLNNLRLDVRKIFGEEIFENAGQNEDEHIYPSTIKNMFVSGKNLATDYYGYILSWYGKDNMTKIADDKGKIDKTHSPEGIKRVCTMIPNIINLAISGILTLGVKIDKDENEPENINDIISNCKEYTKAISEYYIISGKANDEAKEALNEPFNKLYENIKTKYIEVSKESNYLFNIDGNEFKNLLNIIDSEDLSKTYDALNDANIIKNANKSIENPKSKFGEIEDNNEKISLVKNICLAINDTISNNETDYNDLKECIIAVEEIVNGEE